jgi:hypothetical protein
MSSRLLPPPTLVLAVGLLSLLLCGGCRTVHTVTVDAISNAHKPSGQSYRLEVLDPSGGVETALQEQAVATIKDTLGARGLYEVPDGTKPDMIINFEYGVGRGHIKVVTERNKDILIGSPLAPESTSKAVVVYDKFIELTAREAIAVPDPAHPGAPPRPGDELWNIRATIEDTKKNLEPFLSALGSACIDYLGANTGKELHFKVDADAAKAILKQRSQPATPVATK